MRRNAPTCLEKHLENKVRGLLKTRKLRTMLNTHGRRWRMRSMPLSLVMLFFTSVSNRLVIDTSVSIYLHLDSNVRLWTIYIIGICLLQSRSKIYVYVYIYLCIYMVVLGVHGNFWPPATISYLLNLLWIFGAWIVLWEKGWDLKLLHVEFIQNEVAPQT